MTRSRTMPFRIGLPFVIAVTGLLAACGDDTTIVDHDPVTTTPVTTAPPAVSTAQLTIVAGDASGADTRGTATLQCGATATGTAWLAGDKAVAACAAIATEDVRAALGPQPADVMCTMIYGGDDIAHITGTSTTAGATMTVDATLGRKDGCQIDRWTVLQPLLPEPVGVTGPPASSRP